MNLLLINNQKIFIYYSMFEITKRIKYEMVIKMVIKYEMVIKKCLKKKEIVKINI